MLGELQGRRTAHSQPKPKRVREGHISDKENILKEVTNFRDLSNINMVLTMSTSSAMSGVFPHVFCLHLEELCNP